MTPQAVRLALVLACAIWMFYSCTAGSINPKTCDTAHGWSSHGSNCYKKMDTPNGWLGARYDCFLERADLVSITTEDEELFVKEQLGDKPFWIGLSNLKCDKDWCIFSGEKKLNWSDTAVTPTYTNWDSSQDGSANVESCAYVNQGGFNNPGKWRHGSCGSSLAYMCKRSPNDCPDGWPCSYKDFGYNYSRVETSFCDSGEFLYKDSCYHFEGTHRTWQEAENFCKNKSGHLANVHSQGDKKYLAAHMRRGGWWSWLGLKKNNGNLEWRDGSTTADVPLVNPTASYDCSKLTPDGKVQLEPCTGTRPHICQKGKARNSLSVLPAPTSASGLIKPKTTCDAVNGWTAHGSHCYKKMETPNGWMGAHHYCLWEGADLVSITSKDEEIFVKEQMGDKPFWIGLSNLNCDKGWCIFLGEKRLTWSSTNMTPTYANWDSHQDGSANVVSCAYVNQGVHLSSQPGKWRHGSCGSSLAFMCKWSPDDCPDGWPCSYKDFGYNYSRVETSFCNSSEFLYKDSCYHFEGTWKTWQAAEDLCKNKSGQLASVHSQVDGQFLAAHRPQGWWSWLGLNRTNGNLEWRDRSATADVPLVNPTASYDCSKLTDDGKVELDTCETLRPSICQKGKARNSLSVLPASTSASGSVNLKTCDTARGWSSHGSHCYKKMETPNGWLGARYDCLWEGGDLVSITSEVEEMFVKEQMGDKPFWIGLSNLNCDEDVCEFLEAGEKRLTWSDAAVTPTYANWDSRQDGSANVGSCAYVNQGVHLSSQPGKWRHGSCGSSLAYMCKWSPDDCPDGWPCSYKDLGYGYRRVETSFCDAGEFLYKDSCYHFEGGNLTWEAAEGSCKEKKGLLASIHSQVDGQFLAAHRPRGWWSWLGLKMNNGNLEWRDGSATDDVPLYLPTTPYDCSKLTSDGEVYMDTCKTLRPSICQKGKARESLPLLPAPTSATGKSAKCGWWQENPANDDFCYLINSKANKTWKEARDKCARLRGNLLGISDSQDHTFVQGLLPNASSSLWLDANDTMVEDGSKKSEQSSPSSVQLAAAGNPGDRSGRRCNLLGGKGGREVGDCEKKRGYVCKRRVLQTCDRTKGWRRLGSKCYKKMAATNGWLGARYDCVLEGGDLVSITSPYEEIFAKEQMGDKPFWIGRSNLKCNEAWCQLSEAGEKRLAGSDDTAATPTYANWDSRQDRSADVGSCAYVNQGAHGGSQPGKWRHGSCGSSLAYMCERPLDACQEGRLCSYKDYGLGYHRVETSYCDTGDFLYKDSCYHFEGKARPWAGAERFCQEWNGHLTSVLSWEERQFLAAHAPYVEGLQSWVGLKKNKGNFEWSDSTPAGNTEWVPNGPIGRGDCAALTQTGKLEDWPCTKNQPFICKKAKVQDFLLSLPPPGRSAKCGWWLERTSSDFCYLIQRRPTKIWKEARDDCRRRGGDLLSITDSQEQDFVQNLFNFLPSAPSLWLGVNNNITKDGSQWTDGSPFAYIVMDGDDPGDLSGASCLSLRKSNDRWKFDDCRKRKGYVCKKRGNVPKPSQQPHDGFKEILVCNDRSADLVCEAEGQKQGRISIQSAFYGRRSWDVCLADGDSYNYEYCAVEGILPRYRTMCNSQQECHIELLSDESCPASSSKYLQMVYSCEEKVCLESLGIADGSLADSSFIASSSMEDATPEKARLDGESCWKPSKAPIGSWIQVNLGYTRKVTGIVTQGCDGANTSSWNIHLEMKLSVNWRRWTEHPNGKFIGGGTHLLETPAFAQYVRILPLENRPEFGLRFDILGCPHEDETTCARTFNSLHVTDAMTFYCPPGCDKEEHFVFGSMVYSAGSHICAAAIHAGVIRSDVGGDCVVMRAPKQQVYTGSSRNGITSSDLVDPLGASHTFGDGEPRCSAADWEEFAGFCYKTFEGKKKWDDAQLVCRGLGAHLVSIRSEVEQATVKNVSNLETSDMWTGLNDLALAGTLVWSDGHEVTFTHWAAGEPSQRGGLGKHCVAVLRQTGRWKLMSCAQVNSFMCKVPTAHFPIASPTPTMPVVSVPKVVANPSPMLAPGKSPSSEPQAAGGETLQRRPPSKSSKKKKKKKKQN